MNTTTSSKVFISKISYATRELMEINSYIDLNDKGKGYVRDIIFVSFTPGMSSKESSTGYSFDIDKRESMSFHRLDIRALSCALKAAARLILDSPINQDLPAMNTPYRKFTDSSKSIYASESKAPTGCKSLNLQVSRHKEKSMVNLHYSGTQGQKVNIIFDAYQALAFAEELDWQADELSRQTAHFQQKKQSQKTE